MQANDPKIKAMIKKLYDEGKKMPIPKTLNIDVQQGNGSYDVTFDPKLPCEDCFDEKTNGYLLGAYGKKGDEVGFCFIHYNDATWLDKKAIITIKEWF